jgi:prepilin-type N-terminal cleavage/methylation domain-containing protein
MNSRKGFTLIELLAVIVILAIILAVAIPGISGIIDGATKGSFQSDVKMMFKAIDFKMANDSTFNPTTIDESNINSLLNNPSDSYEDIIVTNVSNTINIVAVGKNNWKGYVAYGTRNDLKVAKMPAGLVGYWSFDGNANDNSGTGNNGAVNGATLTTDNKNRNNSAYSFDGVDDYIDVPYSASLAPTSQISISYWAYKPNWATPFGRINYVLSKTETGGYSCAFDGESSGGLVCSVRRNNEYMSVPTTYTSFIEGWHHVTFTFDGRYNRLYVDGLLQNTGDSGAVYALQYSFNNDLLIGAEVNYATAPVAGSYFTGKLDNIRIYNKALTDTEVKLIYDIEK